MRILFIILRKRFWLPCVWRVRREQYIEGLKVCSLKEAADLHEEIQAEIVDAETSQSQSRKIVAQRALQVFKTILKEYGNTK